jgi:bis(5'-adenosyl)-triphosphatase
LEYESPFLKNCSQSVFHDNTWLLALYNIAPVVPGHSLVLPRRPVARMTDLSTDESRSLVPFALEVIQILERVFKTPDFNWIIQDGQSAGQTVFHVHLHLIPRHQGDVPDPGDWYPQFISHQSHMIDSQNRPRLNPNEVSLITQRLAEAKAG